jgi:hypothetical protein
MTQEQQEQNGQTHPPHQRSSLSQPGTRRIEKYAIPLMGEADLPPLSEEDQAALADFQARQQAIADLTLGCIDFNHTGAYISGPPGVSKTHTINNTLRERKASWRLHQRITAKPLYLELEQHPGAVHVIDDCEQIFSEKNALTLLRSALGGERVKGQRERKVSYSVAGSHARVMEHYFHGAIIFTSNRPLADEKPEARAVMSRIPSLCFAPPDREIKALMRHVARQGHAGETGSMSALECVEVVEYVIDLAGELKCRLDLRWIEHGYGHYLTQATSGGTVDWRDQVKFHMMHTITYFDHAPPATQGPSNHRDGGSDEARKSAIAQEIAQTPGLDQIGRLRQWEQRTGLSKPTYYRWLQKGRNDPTAD